MSTLHLRAQLEPLAASAKRLGALRTNELELTLNDLAAVNHRLDSAWSGDARAAFDAAFAGTLARLALADSDLGRLQVHLQTVAAGYRELDSALVAALGDEDRRHDNASTHAARGVGPGIGGAGPYVAAGGGSIVRASLSGNPLEDLWNWIMSWFGAGSSPTPTPTPGAAQAFQSLNNGFAGWGTPEPTSPPWAYPLACTDAASTDPNHPQPYLNNATCNALLAQLDPAYAAQLHQQVQSGDVTLELMTVGGMITLVAHSVATGERQPIAATVEQGDNDEQPGTSGSAGSSGGGPGQRPDPNRVVETIEEQIRRVGQQRFDELAFDPKRGEFRTEEAQVALDLEHRGAVPGPVRRSPYGGEFFDGANQEWDIKQFNSFEPPERGGFTVQGSLDHLYKEFQSDEFVVVDTRNMTPAHIKLLWEAVQEHGIGDKVLWWP